MKDVVKLKPTEEGKKVEKPKPSEPVTLKQGEHLINNVKYKCRFGYEKDFVGYVASFVKGHLTQILNQVERKRVIQSDPKSDAYFSEGAKLVVPSPGEDEKIGIHYLRNHPTLNDHIKELLLIWMANIDTKYILHPEQLEEYVTKYCCKNEQPTHHFTNVLKASIAKCNPNSTMRSACQKALIQGNVRDVSRQEAFLQLDSSLNYVECSKTFKYVSLSGCYQVDLNCQDTKKKVAKKNDVAQSFYKRAENSEFQMLCQLYETDRAAFNKKFSPKYVLPKHPNEISFHEFVANYNCNWKPNSIDVVPIISPYFLKPPGNSPKNKAAYERFCWRNLLVYKPGCTPQNVIEGFETLHDALEDFVRNSPDCPSFLKEDFEKSQKIGLKEQAKNQNPDGFNEENNAEDDEIEKAMADFPDEGEEDDDDRLFPNLCPPVPEDTDYDTKLNRELIELHQRNGLYEPSEAENDIVMAQDTEADLTDLDKKDIIEDYYDARVIEEFKNSPWDLPYQQMRLTPESLEVWK